MKCNRCGKGNPAEIHTCTAPLSIALAERLDVPPGAPLFVDAAAELRRLHSENEALREALQDLCKLALSGESVLWTAEYDKARAALTRAGELK
jgi:hypothetical protein